MKFDEISWLLRALERSENLVWLMLISVSFLSATMQREDLVNLLSGAAAGTTVDVVLFPLDTIKTRSSIPSATPN